MPAEVALGLQLGDEPLERNVLMCQRIANDAACLGKQLPEARCALQVRREHDGVREQTNGVVEIAALAAHHGRPDVDLVLAAEPVEEDVVRGEEHHEHRRALVTRSFSNRRCELSRKPRPPRRPAIGRHDGARTVRRQLEDKRDAREALAPVGYALLECVFVCERARDPTRKVGVLGLRPRQLDRNAGCVAGIEGAELPQEDDLRPPIADDVVEGELQYVLVVPHAKDRASDRQLFLEQERRRDERVRQPLCLAVWIRRRAEIVERYVEFRCRVDELQEARAVRGESSSKRFVPRRHLAHAADEGIDVQLPPQARAERHVVHTQPGRHLLDEPQALLRGCPDRGSFRDRDRMRRGEGRRSGVRDSRGERFDRGRIDELREGDRDPERIVDRCQHADGEQRVAAQPEEVVMEADPLDVEDVAP